MNLSVSLEAKLAAAAQQHGITPAEMATEALEYWLEVDEWTACRISGHQPNAETVKAFAESRREPKPRAYSQVSELFAALDRE